MCQNSWCSSLIYRLIGVLEGLGVLAMNRVGFNLIFIEFELSTSWIGLSLFQLNSTLIEICIPLMLGYRYIPDTLGLGT
jgi:hypothetical protein